MYYNEFLKEIEKQLKEKLEENREIVFHQVMKNNGVLLDAVSIRKKEEMISPTIYLNSCFEQFKEGKTIDEITDEIIELYETHLPKEEWNVEQFLSFDYIQDKIVFKVINYDKNKELLKNVPHKKILDLAIVFYCLVDHNEFENASILIRQEYSDMWGISKEELYLLAMRNATILLPYQLENMEKIMKEMFYESMEHFLEDGKEEEIKDTFEEWIGDFKNNENRIPMYILTNQTKTFGAACMFYPKVLERFSEKIGQDLYILPSSVHEVILLPADEIEDKDGLAEMVKDVNRNEVAEEEILSDHVYFFSKDTKKLEKKQPLD